MISNNIYISDKSNEKRHKVIECCLEKKDEEYNEILKEAEILMKNVNKHAPDGHIRTDKEKLVKCFGGLVAEYFVLNQLNKVFKESGYINLIAEKTEFNPKKDIDQIDIIVRNIENNKNVKIEVRSSYILKSNDLEVYNNDASLVGYYVTKNKSIEKKKNYYITVIFRKIWVKINKDMSNFNFNEKIVEYIKYRIDHKYNIYLHIAGAASLKKLEHDGIESNLKNNGANYKIIKPIICANSIFDEIEEIYIELQ